jgi:hypothetical protein
MNKKLIAATVVLPVLLFVVALFAMSPSVAHAQTSPTQPTDPPGGHPYGTVWISDTYNVDGIEAMEPLDADNLVDIYSWSHDLWNAGDIRAFVWRFNDVIYYTDMPTGWVVYSIPDMINYANVPDFISDDLQMKDRYYHQADNKNLVYMYFSFRGTNDVDGFMGFPATGLPFDSEWMETILFDNQTKGLGGSMYYDRLQIIEQLGHELTIKSAEEIAATPPRAALPAEVGDPTIFAGMPRPMTLIQQHKWMHDQFNARTTDNLLPAISAQGVDYRNHATYVDYTTGQQLIDELNQVLALSTDAQIYDREYSLSSSPNGASTLSEFRLVGTDDVGVLGHEPTGKAFDIPMSEILKYNSEHEVVSGGIWYDRASLLWQLGIIDIPAYISRSGGLLE